jgi:hypothetical protein
VKKYIAALVVTLMLAGTALGGDKAAKADAAKRQAAIQNTAIIAGQSIGELRLGMGMDEVESMLGKPSGWKYLPTGGKSVSEASSWFYNDLNLEIFFGRGAVPVVTSIRTAGWPHKRIKSGNFAWKDIDPLMVKFQTAEGITIGSSAFDVQRAYSNYEWHGQTGSVHELRVPWAFFRHHLGSHRLWYSGVQAPIVKQSESALGTQRQTPAQPSTQRYKDEVCAK